METDHIRQPGEGGTDSIDNAIPVCFECHAEIHTYNDNHPRGRKFRPEELLAHKEQWLKICSERPDVLVSASREIDVGPLQALIDELDFNERVAAEPDANGRGCLFQQAQFLRAIHQGSVAILRDEVRDAVLEAYRAIGAANTLIEADQGGNAAARVGNKAQRRIIEASKKIGEAKKQLLRFLSSEGPDKVA